MLRRHEKFPGVYWVIGRRRRRSLATKNLVPGFRSYDERALRVGRDEYRIWDPGKSKPAAAILNGMKNLPMRPKSKILYLGIASGTTASHFSDIIGSGGIIYGVDVAERAIRDLIRVAETRKNIVPILASARLPQDYIGLVEEVDVVYEDVAQPDQVSILVKNSDIFLRENGMAMIAVKASSVDVTKSPKEVYKEARQEIMESGYRVLETTNLAPHDRKHAIIVARK